MPVRRGGVEQGRFVSFTCYARGNLFEKRTDTGMDGVQDLPSVYAYACRQ